MTVLDIKKQEKNIEFETMALTRDEMTQKRCFVAELAKKALDKFLNFDDLVVENTYSLYNLPLVNEKIDIIDFEVNGLDVHLIPTVDKAKNLNVYIPQIYKQYNIKPDVIVFVNFTKALMKMEIVGYTTNIDLNKLAIPKNLLSSADSLIDVLKNSHPKAQTFSSNAINTTKELMLAYIEEDLSEEGERFFLKHLISSKEIRKNYKLFYSLNSNFVSIAQNSSFEKNSPFASVAENPIQANAPRTMILPQVQEEVVYEEKQLEEKLSILDNDVEENRVETFARSSFLVEQPDEYIPASNLVEEEPLEPLMEENLEEPETFAEDFEQENQQQEEQLIAQEEVQQEDIEETIIEDTPETVALLEEETELGSDDEGFDLQEVDLSDDFMLQEVEPLEDLTEEPLEEMVEENDFSVASSEPVSEDTSLLQEENLELEDVDLSSDDDLVELLDENIEEQTTVAESTEEAVAAEDDDIFAFLSDMADDEVQTTQIDAIEESVEQFDAVDEQEILDESYSQEQDDTLTQEPDTSQVNEQPQRVVQEQPTQEMSFEFGQQNNNSMATQSFVQNQQDAAGFQQTFEQPMQDVPTKPKSSKGLLAVCLVLAMASYGVYQYKDTLMATFGLNQEIAGLMEEETVNVPPPVLPAPIDQSQNAGTQTPPAPTGEAPAPNDKVPAATPEANAQQGAQNPSATPQQKPATTAEKINPDATPQKLPNLPKQTVVEPPKPKNLNDAIAIALTKDYRGVRISKVSWEVSETLLQNAEVSRGLTLIGRNVKTDLSQKLLEATEPSFKDKIVVSISYRKDGTVAKTQITGSSGSQQIDKIILDTVKSTVNMVKMPVLNLEAAEYDANLIIQL